MRSMVLSLLLSSLQPRSTIWTVRFRMCCCRRSAIGSYFLFSPDISHANDKMNQRFLLTFSIKSVQSPHLWWALPWDVLIV
jgi:hypothetical protein